MIFENLTLEALEARLTDAIGRQTARNATKTELTDALIATKDAGRSTVATEKKLGDCRGEIELVDREVALVKDAIIDFHRRELDQEFAALPADRAQHAETAKRLADEARELLERAAAIFLALRLEHADTLRRIVGKTPSPPPELAAFVSEHSRIAGLAAASMGQYRQALLSKRVSRSSNRIGIKIMDTTFLRMPGEASNQGNSHVEQTSSHA